MTNFGIQDVKELDIIRENVPQDTPVIDRFVADDEEFMECEELLAEGSVPPVFEKIYSMYRGSLSYIASNIKAEEKYRERE